MLPYFIIMVRFKRVADDNTSAIQTAGEYSEHSRLQSRSKPNTSEGAHLGRVSRRLLQLPSDCVGELNPTAEKLPSEL